MPPTIVATPGAVDANSYLTENEATTYFAARLYSTTWTASTEKAAALIMATRLLDALLSPHQSYISPTTGINAQSGYFITRPAWTGSPSSTTQALAWPRTGMLNRNGVAIDTTVIPRELKEATAEFAGQLLTADRSLDNDVAVQGITSIKAGPVALSFKENGIETAKMLPEAVLMLLVPSWMSAEIITNSSEALFDVIV